MEAAFNPHHPKGFLAIAAITFVVVLAILPLLDYVFSAAAEPVSS